MMHFIDKKKPTGSDEKPKMINLQDLKKPTGSDKKPQTKKGNMPDAEQKRKNMEIRQKNIERKEIERKESLKEKRRTWCGQEI